MGDGVDDTEPLHEGVLRFVLVVATVRALVALGEQTAVDDERLTGDEAGVV